MVAVELDAPPRQPAALLSFAIVMAADGDAVEEAVRNVSAFAPELLFESAAMADAAASSPQALWKLRNLERMR